MKAYLILCKPRVVLLMLLTVWAGMYLAAPASLPWALWITATIGIALMSGAAATFNHVIDQRVDRLMDRTKKRPLVTGSISPLKASCFAIVLAIVGFLVLWLEVNALTAILTLFTAIGYAAIYSIYLKRATSQNIVIGGLSGAMPPLLGWTAATNHMSLDGWALVLIIFLWTPAHFWALCIHRYEDYKKTTIPMLPITHGIPFTKVNISIYSFLTVLSSLLPFALGMSRGIYLISAIVLGVGFMAYTLRLQFSNHDSRIAIKTFRYSIIYLMILFVMLLVDHHINLLG